MNKLSCKEIIHGLPPELAETDIVAMDLELTGLKENQLHRPFGRMLSLACCFDGETAYIIFEENEVQEFLNRIEKATWIFHNSVFDVGHLRRWAKIEERKNMRDTMLIERLMFPNYYDDFKLNDLVRRYLGCYMEKETRKEFAGLESAMTPKQIEYAALDVLGTWLVDKEQQKIIDENDKVIWNNLYNPHVWTTLELGGFKLDVDAWRALADKNQAIVDEVEERLGKKYGHLEKKMVGRGKNKVETEVFVPFNPSSSAQVLKILKEKGLGVDSTGDDVIRPYYEKNDFVKDILDYRKAEKQVSTYGLKFLQNVEEDGRIYTSLNIGLAESGRDSSSSPNCQNIPRNKERRACFIAGERRKLVLYDYSGQEAGTWAFITGDEKFKEIINSGKKLYIEVAKIAFDEEIVKGTERYDVIKALVLLLMYGGTAYGFARDNNLELDVAEEMVKKFMIGFPTSAKWIKDQQSRNRGVAKTIIGRRGHLHPYDRQWKNNALNTPNQGSGGDMIKLAMKKLRQTEFYKKYYPLGKVWLLLQVHDEIISEVVEELAEEWDSVMKQTMIDAAESLTPSVRAMVSGGIIDNWSQKQ